MIEILSFRGKAQRFEWWTVSLVAGLLVQVGLIGAMAYSADERVGGIIFGVVLALLTLVSFWADLAVTIRRLRDRERPVWTVLLVLIPYLGAIWLIIECGILGTPGQSSRKKVVKRTMISNRDESEEER